MAHLFIRKTILIRKDQASIFKILYDFHQWPKWSPWLIADPKANIQIEADGKSYRWFLFDQILLSENWRFKTNPFFIKAAVYNPPFLRNPEGKYIGYPYRNSVQGKKLLGFSDHFPVYVLIGKKSVKE